ncbi:protein O-linked-mannose beta-1,2-N-acetylglucosaminyltransferase 1-like [Oratosquilla oratoria]|uniref:protein O-linked-mannose beta-1,2-N-acetylglucosaminyltransferase 1-like n=1 Tax=Oratosquilla oratoria TaxID=337810 RepID=UPI003F77006D
MSDVMSTKLFSHKNYNRDPNARIVGIERLRETTYESDVEALLEKAFFPNTSQIHPCRPDFDEFQFPEGHDVIAFSFRSKGDPSSRRYVIQEYYLIAKCLGIFFLEPREFHRGLLRLRRGSSHLLLIADPFSPYRGNTPQERTLCHSRAVYHKDLLFQLRIPTLSLSRNSHFWRLCGPEPRSVLFRYRPADVSVLEVGVQLELRKTQIYTKKLQSSSKTMEDMFFF